MQYKTNNKYIMKDFVLNIGYKNVKQILTIQSTNN